MSSSPTSLNLEQVLLYSWIESFYCRFGRNQVKRVDDKTCYRKLNGGAEKLNGNPTGG